MTCEHEYQYDPRSDDFGVCGVCGDEQAMGTIVVCEGCNVVLGRDGVMLDFPSTECDHQRTALYAPRDPMSEKQAPS